ncbi:MAG: hypothetical protein JNJ54_05565 [Myxococcaceae bacterium]|nr:hypothetical protein [Myxococcaceae bacterium]
MSVADFGAKGDSQTDDTAAFKCALRWFAPGGGGASNGGGIVRVPGGHYNISDTLDVPAGVQLIGVNSTQAGFCQVRLITRGRPLLRLRGVALADVVIRDLELRNLGPGVENWPIREPIARDSATVGLLVTGDLPAHEWVRHLTVENVRIAGFTMGISASSGLEDRARDPMLDGVQLDQVVLENNTVGLHARSWNMSNWNVHNLTVFQGQDQVGVRVEGANLHLLQLNCEGQTVAGRAVTGPCLELAAFTSMRVTELHAEGTTLAIRVLPSATPHQPRLLLEHAFLGEGVLVEGTVWFNSVGSSFPGRSTPGADGTPGRRRVEFVGEGSFSHVVSVSDRWVNPFNGELGGDFRGLVTRPQRLDERGVEAQQVSVRGQQLPGPLLELIAPTQPGQPLLRLGQENFHYTLQRNGENGFLSVIGNQVSQGPNATWPNNVEWTGLDINGALRLKRYGAAPNTCADAFDGAVVLTQSYTTCVCRPALGWVSTADGRTGCAWR